MFYSLRGNREATQKTGHLRPDHGGQKERRHQYKCDILVCNWDILRIRAKETHENLILLNSYLDDVRAEILNAHKKLHSARNLVTAKEIKLMYLGEAELCMSLMDVVITTIPIGDNPLSREP